ncbi:Translation initiation factor IF-2 [Chlamydiales bacterium SCGC AB-751-O23]|nr:Translation initiation factor IF-2 [Chlamydiales bacterium SCGC AB-751-O23]
MAKNLKLNIKNAQISKAMDLSKLKTKLAKKTDSKPAEEKPKAKPKAKAKAKPKAPLKVKANPQEEEKELPPKRTVKARTKSAFIPKEVPTATPSSVQKAPTESTTTQTLAPQGGTTSTSPSSTTPPRLKLGPTGRHVNDLIRKEPPRPKKTEEESSAAKKTSTDKDPKSTSTTAPQQKLKEYKDFASLGGKETPGAYKPFKDPNTKKKRTTSPKSFDSRDRMGLRSQDDSDRWRKKRPKAKIRREETTIRPSSLHVRLPVSVKDLAGQMKLKSSQLIGQLLIQGLIVTLNDFLDDETTIQLLGHEFNCEIAIDTSEEDRIRITDKTADEEISLEKSEELSIRPPIITFMGHVDHGKTSLIDAIRGTNVVAGEAGAITQHFGAFKVVTPQGNLTILDTPGHEAFSAMRARGANLTDIVVLVIAGDDGIKQQTEEAISHAKAAKVPMIVAINKCDKPGYNPENVYRQLADNDLLPESWGGQIITVNCSAKTKEGIPGMLEMLALQAEILEIKANPKRRARGTVVESQMHKGFGATTTLVVQNGTLKPGDAVVFNHHWGKIKNLYDDDYKSISEAAPSCPCRVTGISGLPEAGDDFIVVKDEREAKEIAETRHEDSRQNLLQTNKKLHTLESLLQTNEGNEKKTLNVILRTDVQGTLEALKNSLMKIESDKIDLQIIHQGVGDISESDLQLAAASKALVIGFHTNVESRAENLVKILGVQLQLHSIIYEAITSIKTIMAERLDKVVHEDEEGNVEVKAIFKASQFGKIAGCQVKDGLIKRSHKVKLFRNDEVIWKGNVGSLKREKDDVKEVLKGMECGILLDGFNDFEEGDIIQSYSIRYESQEL